jgi:hypothetical protein
MENELVFYNIIINCFVIIIYIFRKVLNRNKPLKISKDIIDKINELNIANFTIDHLLNEIKNILKPENEKIEIIE